MTIRKVVAQRAYYAIEGMRVHASNMITGTFMSVLTAISHARGVRWYAWMHDGVSFLCAEVDTVDGVVVVRFNASNF